MTTDTQTRIRLAATTTTIRIRLENADIARLREIATAERRDPREQAALLLERALRAYGESEQEGE
jgi:hypothetical protein